MQLIYNSVRKIPIDSFKLEGELIIPENAVGIVIFSHGSGSSRHSPRNKFVTSKLQERGLATLMVDLLTSEEDQNYSNRFDIKLLIERLILVTNWVKEEEMTAKLEAGYFGASTGAASALGAAAMIGEGIKAVVSRGGRPDLAMPYLQQVRAAALLLVGTLDYPVIELNEKAYAELASPEKNMITIEGATHLFEEPGKLEEVAELAGKWFSKYL